MNNHPYLIIKTNSYVGNFDRELMAYVFGYDANYDGYASAELDIFDNELGQEYHDKFYECFDSTAFGEYDSEYSCYKIDSHPTNKQYFCDSFFICLNKKMPKELSKIMFDRLNNFCDYYNKTNSADIKILDINYFQNKFVEIDEETLWYKFDIDITKRIIYNIYRGKNYVDR